MPRVASLGSKSRKRRNQARNASAVRWSGKENEPEELKTTRAELVEARIQQKKAEHEQIKAEHARKNAERREKRAKKDKEKLKREAAEAQRMIDELEEKLRQTKIEAERKAKCLLKQMAKQEADFRKQLDKAHALFEEEGQYSQKRIQDLLATEKAKVRELRSILKNFKAKFSRAQTIRTRVKERRHQAKLLAKMKKRGAYTPELRALARLLVECGCKQGRVGEAIRRVAKLFGVDVEKVMDRRTVGRIVLEGYVMSQMQVAFEIQHTEDLTLSGDSTSRRHLNYQSHHTAMRVPEMSSDGTVKLSERPVNRFLGIRSTVDHTSDTSLDTWFKLFGDVNDTYQDSPLAKRTAQRHFDLRLVCLKLRGLASDHANGEKAVSNGWESRKTKETIQDLGEKRKAEMATEEVEKLLLEWNTKKILDVGGTEIWEALPPAERAARDLATMNAMVDSLGREAFNALDDQSRRALTLYIWTGCCMHKDQNSFKGGNDAMVLEWLNLALTAPIPLANKWNAKAVQQVVAPELGSKEVSEADIAQLESTTRGGAKTAALAGAIFNNACDKKGQGDTHIIFFTDDEAKLIAKRFPGTNNTRFGSHGEAAGELLARRERYIEFLQHIRLKKTTSAFTNIELNVYNALHDGPTLTELAVLALYQQMITHPYSRMVRRPEEEALNALDLGPLHVDLREHVERLIAWPDLILDFDEDAYRVASFDGKPWEREDVVSVIAQMHKEEKLPYLEEMLVAFLRGALITWIRFSSEYAPGGLIDGLTDEEKARAYRFSTNCSNEGSLGSFIVRSRNSPSATVHQINALMMFTRNHTQAFVDTFFNEEDHRFVMKKARELDASGLERQRLKEQAEFDKKLAEMKKEREGERARKEAETTATLASRDLITCVEDIRGKTRPELDIQLEKLRRMWGKKIDIPLKSHITRLGEKQEALKLAFKEHCRLLEEVDGHSEDDGMVQDATRTTVDWHEEEDAEMED